MSEQRAEWYAVTDRLPYEQQFVWVHDDGETYLGHFYPPTKFTPGGVFYAAEGMVEMAEGMVDSKYISGMCIYPTHWAYLETPQNAPGDD